jgi:hypothetical protein
MKARPRAAAVLKSWFEPSAILPFRAWWGGTPRTSLSLVLQCQRGSSFQSGHELLFLTKRNNIECFKKMRMISLCKIQASLHCHKHTVLGGINHGHAPLRLSNSQLSITLPDLPALLGRQESEAMVGY